MDKVICFGEIMLRLNPEGHLRFCQTKNFQASYAGAEANVAVSLANFGLNSAFITKLPENDISKAAIRDLKGYNIDVSNIVYGGDRLGIYFLEKGASQRASKVIYDRKYSSIATAEREDFNWAKIFNRARWFHFTGITPALSDSTAEICLDACKYAKEKGVTISCDLNYRKNLWTTEKAGLVMRELMKYVDLCIANEEDAEKVFGIEAEHTDVDAGKLNYEGYRQVAQQIASRFGCKGVAITLRGSISANDNNWAGMLYSNGECCFSKSYLIHIVDRVGGGDSFCGALIYSLISGYTSQDAIEFAVAASCLKHTIEFDYNQVTVCEVKNLIKRGGSGRVQR